MLGLTNFLSIIFCSTYSDVGLRVFDMNVEGKLLRDIDIVALSGTKQPNTAITINVVRLVEDGFASLSFLYGLSENPKVSGIEIVLVAPHLAHAVAGTSSYYSAVDIQNVGQTNITLDGSASHTHGIGLSVTQWIWREIISTNNNKIIATGASPTISLPVGNHTLSLSIVDSAGNDSTDTTTVSIYPFGYPAITQLIPDRGTIAGETLVQIVGSGFNYRPQEMIVHFGIIDLTGPNDIQVINSTTILVRTPATTIGAPIPVTVETPLQTSAPISYTYIASSEIKFTSGQLYSLRSVTTGAFGPDGKLYLGTYYGYIARLTLNEDYTQVIDSRIVLITDAPQRAILGIAFDPNDVDVTNPSFYCTSSQFFHKAINSTSGLSINGKIYKVSGANLEIVEDIIVGLPVSDHDHGT
jgi:IPT/TIG domain